MEGLIELNHFGFLEVAGKEAEKFLQGYTTCDLESLNENSVKLGAICDIKGRMITSFLIIIHDKKFVLRMNKDLVEKTISFLQKYIIFSKADLKNKSDEMICYGSADPDSNSWTVKSLSNGFEIGLVNRKELWLTQIQDDASKYTDQWADLEIDTRQAWITSENSELLLPQSLNYHMINGVDFGKGCYLGQEVISRTYYRGKLKKKLHVIDKPIDSIEGGLKVNSGQKRTLVVLRNETDQSLNIKTSSDEDIVATPV